VLEVGAGDGSLADALSAAGYEVVAIDPASEAANVRAIALHALDEPPASFDAAVAVLSMHHVEPLAESCARLGEVVRTGGTLVLDEFDVERFSERVARWWLAHREPSHEHAPSPEEVIAHLRHHCHRLRDLCSALRPWFELSAPARGSYLHRWEMPRGMRAIEEQLIADGELPAIGARIVGQRRS
jgi:SAM-dependent methyltransferase